MSSLFHIVTEHVARNPVAQAIAKKRTAQAVRDFQTALYLFDDGEHRPADIYAAICVLGVTIRCHELRGTTDSTSCRVMRGGMSALMGMNERNDRWRAADARAVDQALAEAIKTKEAMPATVFNRAHAEVMQGIREAFA